MRYQAGSDSFVVVCPTNAGQNKGEKGHKKFVLFPATRPDRCGWRSELIQRWFSYPFCRGFDDDRC